MAMRRVSKSTSPVKRIMSGAQRFSINTKDDHILPSSTSTATNSLSFSPSEEDNKYNKRKYNKKNRSTKKFSTCICLCLIGICAGLFFGICLIYIMGHDVIDKNKVVGNIRQKTRETIDSAYKKVSKSLDESQRYQQAIGNVKRIGNRLTKGYRKLRKVIQDTDDGRGPNSNQNIERNNGLNNNDFAVNGQAPPQGEFDNRNYNSNNNIDNVKHIRRKKVIASTFRQRYDKDYNDVLKLLEKERKLRKRTEHEMMNLKQKNYNNKLSNQIIDGVPQRHAKLKATIPKNKKESGGGEISNGNNIDNNEDNVKELEDESDDESEDESEEEDESKDSDEDEEEDGESEEEDESKESKKDKDAYEDIGHHVDDLTDEFGGEELKDPEEEEEKEENNLLGIKKDEKMDEEPDDDEKGNNQKKYLIPNIVPEGALSSSENKTAVKNVIDNNSTINLPSNNKKDDMKPEAESDEDENLLSENIDSVVSNKVIISTDDTNTEAKGMSQKSNTKENGKIPNDKNIILPESGIERKRCRADIAHLNKLDFRASQGQDHFVFKLLNKKRHGFFVEFGVGDGLVDSSTYVFEKRLCWTGLCIEPSKVIFKDLEKNRPECIRVHGAICSKDANGNNKNLMYLDVLDENGQWTGLSGFENKMTKYHKSIIEKKVKKKGWSKQNYPVQCYDLNDLLNKYRPKQGTIDFLSIDVEGFEKEIVESIDFEKNSFGIVQIESNVALLRESNDMDALGDVLQVRQLFKEKGFLARASDSGVDDFFIHPDIVQHAVKRRNANHRRRRHRRTGRGRIRRRGRANYEHPGQLGFNPRDRRNAGFGMEEDDQYMPERKEEYQPNYVPRNSRMWQDHDNTDEYRHHYGQNPRHQQYGQGAVEDGEEQVNGGWHNHLGDGRPDRYPQRRRRAEPIYGHLEGGYDGGY